MGLDMYLRAEKYLSRWEHSTDEERARADLALDAAGLSEYQTENAGVTVQATVGSWRKANQIHRWFVENVQGGVDDCGTYYVDKDQLRALREKCVLVLAASEMVPDTVVVGYRSEQGAYSNRMGEGWRTMLEAGEVILDPEVAQAELPTQDGFFFGGTDYDQWYVAQLVETVEIIDRALAVDAADLTYESSW